MIVAIGEVLIDRFPTYDRIGGAPFNFAYHLAQFGKPVRLLSRVGSDTDGRAIRRLMTERGLDNAGLQADPEHPTGAVDVRLDADGVPRFAIRENVAYDFIDLSPPTTDTTLARAAMLYFGSLIQRSEDVRRQLGRLLARRPETCRCFCDINLRPPHVHPQAVKQCLQHADVLKLSAEELGEVADMLGWHEAAPDAAARLIERYGIELLLVTQGAQGSWAVGVDGTRYEEPAAAVDKIADTVGAGDGFAAVMAWGLIDGWPLERTMRRASEFAAAVCRLPGAVPDGPSFYSRFQRKFQEKPS